MYQAMDGKAENDPFSIFKWHLERIQKAFEIEIERHLV